jgi:hypothetical protein
MKDEAAKTEPFLERWSRLKREAESEPKVPAPAPAKDAAARPPELPSLDTLSFESDFRGFLHQKVEEGLRRAALKKLFGDPRFNVMDGLDVYIDDYSIPDPIPPEMLKKLAQYDLILGKPEEERAAEKALEETPGSPEVAPSGEGGAAAQHAEAAPAADGSRIRADSESEDKMAGPSPQSSGSSRET